MLIRQGVPPIDVYVSFCFLLLGGLSYTISFIGRSLKNLMHRSNFIRIFILNLTSTMRNNIINYCRLRERVYSSLNCL